MVSALFAVFVKGQDMTDGLTMDGVCVELCWCGHFSRFLDNYVSDKEVSCVGSQE